MKRSSLLAFLGISLVIVIASSNAQAQSAPTGPAGSKQDQVIQELLGEVRQLRIALQNISVNAYRGQVLMERLRLQQDQVNRLSQDLNSTRNQIADMKSTSLSAKAKLDDAEDQQDKGLMSATLTARYKEVLEDLKRREQSLGERELQLAAQLEAERANLTDFNKRLDALELEMTATSQSDGSKGPVKR